MKEENISQPPVAENGLPPAPPPPVPPVVTAGNVEILPSGAETDGCPPPPPPPPPVSVKAEETVDVSVEQPASEEDIEEVEEPPLAPPAAEVANAEIDNAGWWLRPFSLRGRITRLEFVLSHLCIIAIAPLLVLSAEISLSMMNDMLPGLSLEIDGPLFSWAAWILLGWFITAQGVKRCHDIGRSGWFVLIPFYCFYLMIARSSGEVSQHGAPATIRGGRATDRSQRRRGWWLVLLWATFSPVYLLMTYIWRQPGRIARLLLFALSPWVVAVVSSITGWESSDEGTSASRFDTPSAIETSLRKGLERGMTRPLQVQSIEVAGERDGRLWGKVLLEEAPGAKVLRDVGGERSPWHPVAATAYGYTRSGTVYTLRDTVEIDGERRVMTLTLSGDDPRVDYLFETVK